MKMYPYHRLSVLIVVKTVYAEVTKKKEEEEMMILNSKNLDFVSLLFFPKFISGE